MQKVAVKSYIYNGQKSRKSWVTNLHQSTPTLFRKWFKCLGASRRLYNKQLQKLQKLALRIMQIAMYYIYNISSYLFLSTAVQRRYPFYLACHEVPLYVCFSCDHLSIRFACIFKARLGIKSITHSPVFCPILPQARSKPRYLYSYLTYS